MRVNSRNWPVWLFAVATVWFVAITFAWAVRPLVDHVEVTVEHVFAPGQPVVPGARDPGPTLDVTCGTPASGAAIHPGDLPDLYLLRDGNGDPLHKPRFARQPCASFHRQSRALWFVNVGLYVLTVSGLAVVMVRRRRNHIAIRVPAMA